MKRMAGVQKTTWTVLVLCLTAALPLACAGGLSTEGNEFFFAFMGNDRERSASDQNAILFVTTEEPNPVQVTVEVNPAFYQNNPNLDAVRFPQSRTQTVVAGTSVSFNFSVSADTGFPDHDIRVYDLASSLDRSSGIRVSTDGGQISLYGINNEFSSIDAFSVYPCHEYPTIPANGAGRRSYEYVILSANNDISVNRESRLMIVGCQDDTEITITPLTQLNTLPASLPPELGSNQTPDTDRPLDITIDTLQSYLLGGSEDLSGTRVVANKPIALFGGHECALVPDSVQTCDHVVQQIPPQPTWGDRFFIIPVPQRYSGEFYRAATTTSDTVLSVTCRTLGDPSPSTVTHVINNAEGWIEFNTAAATSRETRLNEIQWCSVESNNPILLMQYAQGSTADSTLKDIDKSLFGDPFMTIVPPITQYANDFSVPTAKRLRASPLLPSLTIAIPQGEFFRSPQQDQTRIRLNSETVEPDEGWVEIFCSDGEVCGYGGRIESAPEGTVTIEHTTPEAGIGAWIYGIASSVSFGMTPGFRLDPIAFPNLEIVEDVTVSESDTEAVVKIRRIGDISRGSRFYLRLEDGGATRGVDYRDYTVEPSSSFRAVIDADTNEIAIGANLEEVVFTFPIVNDTLNEGTEKFFLHLTPIRRLNAVLTPTGTVTILDSGLRIQFGLVDCSFSDSEDGTVSITVIRFSGLSQNGDIVADITPMTFSAYESMGKSIPRSYEQYDPAETTDFDDTNQRITFTRGGEPEMTVQITTFNDNIKEFDEAFVVVLNIVDDGDNTIQPPEEGRDIVVCTITDDEDSVNIRLDPTSVDLQESDGAVGISVTKSAVSECSLQSVLSISDPSDVDRALEGQDFVINSVDVIIPAFETASSIPIPGITISDDSLPEVTEGFRVGLQFANFDSACSEQNCSHCDCCRTAAVQNIFTIASTVSTVVTIRDNDDTTIGFTAPTAVMPGEGEIIQVCAAVLAPNPINVTIPVLFVIQPGTATEDDYNLETVLQPGDSELSQDQRNLCISISIVDDEESEGFHQFSIELQINGSQPGVVVSPNTITVNIADSDNNCESNPCENEGLCMNGVDTFTCDCAPGFTGELCETDIDECVPNPCQNGGSCTDGVNTFTCDCVSGHTGDMCETDINECAPNPCQNGGMCTDGIDSFTCGCVAGYTGEMCETDVDECVSNPCQNGGTCTDGVDTFTCDCIAGYTGEMCETDIDDCVSNPCQNGGTCTDGVDTFTCDCIAGYTGEMCETDIDECVPNPCQNEGTCTDGVDTFTCDCIAGYTGELCETDIDECVSNPCQNGGTCTDGVDTFTCDCIAGYTGEMCETDIDDCVSNPCQNGGTCTDGVNTFTCDCTASYTGTICDVDISECASNTCQNGGTCIDGINTFTCDCVAGYTGELCETDINECAPNPCQNGGTCTDGVDTFTCDCITGYTGEMCETDIDECVPNPCQNGGTCTDGVDTFTCDCIAGYTGELCDTDIDECVPNPCQNGGTCTDGVDTFTCDCIAGYTGELCETDIDECVPNPCQNGGTCTDGVDSFTCDCIAGYTGELCDTDIDECVPNPCQNGGTCTDGVDSFTCDCIAGYTGELCDTDIDECVPNPCQNGGTCTNGVDSFTCDCVAGYTGELCETDIDECASNPCQNGGTCTDGVNSFTCNCAVGFTGAICDIAEPPTAPPQPDITDVSLIRSDDLRIRWRLPDGVDLNRQPVDNYTVEVRCVGRVDSDSVAVSELLERSVAYREAETTNTEILFSDIELRNKTYLVRVCAQNEVGDTCSGYEIFTPPLPPQPVIISTLLEGGDDDDLAVTWRLPDGIDTTMQPVDNYAVEVRCVDRLEPEDRRDTIALLADSAAYRNGETEDTDIIFADGNTNNKTYIIRVCAQNRVGMTCSEYRIYTPPVSADSSDLTPGIIVLIIILVILGCCCCWLCLLLLFFWCLKYRERQGNYYPYKREKKYRQQYAEYREDEEDSEDFEEDIDEKA